MREVLVGESFLLENQAARFLYQEYAADLPIIDYHSHLPPQHIAWNKRWDNLAQLWLGGDHYKWRAMRSAGVPERFCTGNAPDWEKFQWWAETVPRLLRNPLYHWTHLELYRAFGINDRLLNPETAKGVWEQCNAKLAQPEFTARGLMEKFRVSLACTTDDPTDNLENHKRIAADLSFKVRVLPTFRPDKGMAAEDPKEFNAWVDKLAAAANLHVNNFSSYLQALRKRHDFFHQCGCRISDHGLETACAEPYTEKEIQTCFSRLRSGKGLTPPEVLKFKSAMLYEFALLDFARGWTQQLHLGAMRNNNTRLFKALGPDTGFDSIGDLEQARPLARFLDRLDQEEKLPKTVLYNINPRDNDVLGAMLGNFNDGTIAGKMQLGSAWWFLDHKDGMEAQLRTFANLNLLSVVIGMVTDSRSFLSYARHEYFRRILCQFLGEEVERGLLPRDMHLLGEMVRDICYRNANLYFGFNLPNPV